MDINSKIINTKYVAIPREDIIGWLVKQGILEMRIKDELYTIEQRIDDGKILVKKHLEKWAYFPIIDEREY